MSTNRYLNYQRNYMASIKFDRFALPPKLTINDLPAQLFATILSHALSDRRDGFIPSILNTAKMFRKTLTTRPAPGYLLVNKRFSRIGKQVWLQTDFSHVYIDSWTPLHKGLVASASTMSFVVLTLDIRGGDRALNEKLVPSAFRAKLRGLLHEMKNLESGPCLRDYHEQLLRRQSQAGSQHCQHSLPRRRISLCRSFPPNVMDPTTAYLDESEPLLKIPIWRGCAATRTSAKSAWMPATIEKQPEEEQEVRSAEEDEALTQLLKDRMKDVPWVKDAVRVRKRQQKAQEKKKGANSLVFYGNKLQILSALSGHIFISYTSLHCYSLSKSLLTLAHLSGRIAIWKQLTHTVSSLSITPGSGRLCSKDTNRIGCGRRPRCLANVPIQSSNQA
ncbi:hypothetical protein KCU69_g62, partial [Aureobasidium melanogenum]